MSKYYNSGLTARGETYTLTLIKRIQNSAYEWEEIPTTKFKGRPANSLEKRNYRILQGIEGNQDSIQIFVTKIPEDIQPKDKVIFMGKEWTVASVGYYFENANIVNADLMSDEYIISRCPKGIGLQ